MRLESCYEEVEDGNDEDGAKGEIVDAEGGSFVIGIVNVAVAEEIETEGEDSDNDLKQETGHYRRVHLIIR